MAWTEHDNGYNTYVPDGKMGELRAFVPDALKEYREGDYGVYLLTTKNTKDQDVVVYVGRGNIRERISAHLRDDEKWEVLPLHFCVRILRGGEPEGYPEECRLYHTYGEKWVLLNKKHPPTPAGSALACRWLNCSG